MAAPRINHQPCFLLSSQAWRENSLRLEVFSRDFGRVALLARSARARGSELRGVLVPFVPVSVSWFGRDELKTLHRAEWLGGWRLPSQRDAFSGLYLNELVLKLTAREDPAPELYHALYAAMRSIAAGGRHNSLLRQFEWRLLSALGLAPSRQTDHAGAAINGESHYLLSAQEAAVPCAADAFCPNGAAVVSGSLLGVLGTDAELSPQEAEEAQKLMRVLLNHHLPEGLASRKVLQQLQERKRRWV